MFGKEVSTDKKVLHKLDELSSILRSHSERRKRTSPNYVTPLTSVHLHSLTYNDKVEQSLSNEGSVKTTEK